MALVRQWSQAVSEGGGASPLAAQHSQPLLSDRSTDLLDLRTELQSQMGRNIDSQRAAQQQAVRLAASEKRARTAELRTVALEEALRVGNGEWSAAAGTSTPYLMNVELQSLRRRCAELSARLVHADATTKQLRVTLHSVASTTDAPLANEVLRPTYGAAHRLERRIQELRRSVEGEPSP
jgi:hypothetical protein